MLPNNLKRKSPGNLPMPNFCNQGKRLAKTINPTKMTITQRIMLEPYVELEDVAAKQV